MAILTRAIRRGFELYECLLVAVAADYRYEWLKDGKPLDVDTPLDGVTFRWRAGTGTIIIDPANTAALEGSYQCVARNQFGAAITDQSVVRMAGK